MTFAHEVELLEGSDSSELIAEAPAQSGRLSRIAKFAGLALAACGVAAVVVGSSAKSGVVVQAGTSAIAAKYEAPQLDSWLYDGMWNTDPTRDGKADGIATAPAENRHDGNLCGDDEELSGSLCYKKCSLLTNGAAPYRTTAFTCCTSKPCGLTNQKVKLLACSGYDVSGNINGQEGACPHPPGTCLQNEELLLGVCYKKCSIITNGEYPYRSTAFQCCKSSGVISCVLPANVDTSVTKYDVGGGLGDGNKATPAEPHAPMIELTEAGQQSTAATR